MKLIPPFDPTSLKDRNIFLDNDFLSIIFSDPELLRESISMLTGFLIVSEFTRLEFLRDASLPEIKRGREAFINSDLFSPVAEHNQIFQNVKKNALVLSNIYAHKNRAGVSLVDLLLAGTIMHFKGTILMTGNKKHFPSFLFDTLGVMNFEQKDGTIRAISIITFNQRKFEESQVEYSKMVTARGN